MSSLSQPVSLIQERLQGLLTRATALLDAEGDLTAEVLATLRNVAAAMLQEVDTCSASPAMLEAIPVRSAYTDAGLGRVPS